MITDSADGSAARENADRGDPKKMAGILERITDASSALNHDWRFTFVNTEAQRVSFRKREDLLGANLWSEFPEAVGQAAVSFEAYFPPLEAWFAVRAHPSADYSPAANVYRRVPCLNSNGGSRLPAV